jgi:hypothetical protein
MKLIQGMALAIALSAVGASTAAALEISEATHANYQEYLKTIGSTKRGAFAVAADGYGSYYTYCYDGNCLSSALTQDALTSCKSVTGKECLVMAFGRNERIEFTVVARRTELKDDDAILANVLDADRLKTLIVGNTMQGEYINHKKWMEHYAPDGTLRGKADQLGAFTGSYELKGNTICYHYQDNSDWDWCAQVSIVGETIRFLEDGKLVSDESNTRWLQGNPNNL